MRTGPLAQYAEDVVTITKLKLARGVAELVKVVVEKKLHVLQLRVALSVVEAEHFLGETENAQNALDQEMSLARHVKAKGIIMNM